MEKVLKIKKKLGTRIAKWIGIVFLSFLLIAVALPYIFKSKIIEFAKAEVNNSLNATVSWGEFDLSFVRSFPDFRFTIENLKVIGKGEFLKDTLLIFPELKLDIDLMSVLKGDQYKINSIYLDRPRINAKVLYNGKANWDIVKPPTTTSTEISAAPTKFKLALKNLDIVNGYIVYDDASLVFKGVFDNINYNLKGDFTQDIFLMENSMSIEKLTVVYDGMTYLSKVKTLAKADFDMDMLNWKFTFKENEFSLNDLSFELDGFFAMPGTDYDMDLKFQAKQSEFKSFLSLVPGAYTKDFANVKASGKLAFDGFIKGLYSEKQNLMPGYGLNFNIENGSFQYPSLPKSVTSIFIDCKIDDASGVVDKTIIDLKKFHVDFGGNPVDAGLVVSTPVSDANLVGWIKCKLDLATLKDFIPLEKDEQLNGKINADVKIKGRMSQIEKSQYDEFQLSGTVGLKDIVYKTKSVAQNMSIATMDMNFTPQFIALSKFDAKIGRNDIHATGRIDNLMTYLFKDSLLRGNFNMNSSLIDLNEFMGDASTEVNPADTSSMAIIQVPGNIDFTLNSTISRLIYTDIQMKNVSGIIRLVDKTVSINNLKMNLMGGEMLMNGNYATINPEIPKVNFDFVISDFDMRQTFTAFNTVQQLAPVSKYSNGKFSTSINYTSDLSATMMPILATINGAGILSTKQVIVEGFEPLKKLDEALKLNKFKKVTLSDIKQLKFKIINGAVSTEPFDFLVATTKGKIGGTTGIDKSINYVLDIAILRSDFGAANSSLNGMVSAATAKGIPITLGDVINVQALFTGTITKPIIKTNLKEAGLNLVDELKNTIKDTVKAIVNKVIDDSKDKACAESQKQLTKEKDRLENLKTSEYKLADEAKALAYTQADKLEKSSSNPLQKVANKKLAELARKKADDICKNAKVTSDKKINDIFAKAQSMHDAKCK